MLRIVGVQSGDEACDEFVLLQNQGVLKIHLRGTILTDEFALCGGEGFSRDRMFVFSDDVVVPPSAYVMVVTGPGRDGWSRSRDGSPVYFAYWNRSKPVWSQASAPLHVLGVLHTKMPSAPVSRTAG